MVSSININTHKSLFFPPSGAVVLVKINVTRETSSNKSSLALNSRLETKSPCRAFPIWVTWCIMGSDFLGDLLQEKLLLAKYVYRNLVQNPAVEIRGEPQLCIVAFRLAQEPNSKDSTEILQKRLEEDGRVLPSSTVMEGRTYIRICPSSYRTHIDDIDFCLDVIEQFVSRRIKCFGNGVTDVSDLIQNKNIN